jgi:hypothetical protein
MRLSRTSTKKATTLAAAMTASVAAALVMPASALAEASVHRVGPVEILVPTAFLDSEPGVELMYAECDYVQQVVKPDGSSVETQECVLTEPYEYLPGTPPERAVTDSSGACNWFSYYVAVTTGETVFADSVRLTVTPSGRVSVTSFYAPEPPTVSECAPS